MKTYHAGIGKSVTVALNWHRLEEVLEKAILCGEALGAQLIWGQLHILLVWKPEDDVMHQGAYTPKLSASCLCT